MRLLFIGDIVGKSGRNMVFKYLPELIKKYQIDFVIANGENVTHGKGLIEHHYHQLVNNGIDCITLGNHYESKNEILEYLEGADHLVRPYNIKKDYPGVGTAVFELDDIRIRVTNLLGQAFMLEDVDNPFEALDSIVNESHDEIHIVDFHAEATGEKQSLAWAFDGKITALIGTHTHVQTHDERILPQGTAFMCDVGMCGPYNGVLGAKREVMIKRAWKNEILRYDVENEKGSVLSAVVITIDEDSKKATAIKSVLLYDEHI